MPGLVAYKRRWDVGSDDFVFPQGIEIVVRSFWLVVVAIVFSVHNDAFAQCTSGHLVRIYYIGMLVLLTIHILVSILLGACSMQGAIVDVHRRRGVPYVLYVKAVLFLPELVWLLIGTHWAFADSEQCEEFMVVATIKALVLVGWVMFISLVVGILIVFDPLGHKRRRSKTLTRSVGSFYMDRNTDGAGTATKQLWETRCKWICCCISSDENSKNAFNDIAELFTNFFQGLDLVPTDIAAGLILVQMEQQKAPLKMKRTQLVMLSAPSPEPKRKLAKREKRKLRQQSRSLEAAKNGTAGDWGRGGEAGRSVSVPAGMPKDANQTEQKEILIDIAQHQEELPEPDHLEEEEEERDGDEVAPLLDTRARLNVNSNANGSEEQADPERLPEPQPWMSIHNATHYMRFAMAGYGWPLYMYMNLPLGCCKLCAKCSCCQQSHNENVYYDNICQCNTAAIRSMTGIEEEDIVYASFHNAIYQIPFFVVIDHSRSSIIISIRGTLSLRDALTDLTAESEDVDIAGVEAPCKAHKGIMAAASYVHGQLVEKDILGKAFTRAPTYQLMVTGHSLGAGAATLLSIMLQPAHPTLKCFAFSPPGGLLSISLARYTEPFVCSVVLGSDLVPRLGIVSMEDLKSQVLRCIKDSNKPKYKILAGGVWNAFCGLPKSDESKTATRQPLLNPQFSMQIPCYGSQDEGLTEQSLVDAIQMSGHSRRAQIQLYPPGQIIFIEEEHPSSVCCGEPVYTAAWARHEVFEEILVSPRMLMDHLPDTVFKALMQLADKNFRLREMVRVRTTDSIEEGVI